MMNLKALWILVVFVCCVREGFGSNYDAKLNSKNLLQVRFSSFPFLSEGVVEFGWDLLIRNHAKMFLSSCPKLDCVVQPCIRNFKCVNV